MLLPLAERPMLDFLLDRIRDVDELDEIHLVTNSRFAPAFRDWAPEDVTVHDDGTTSNEDRLGAIGDIAFTIERAGLSRRGLLLVAGDNLMGYSLPEYVAFWREKGGSAIAVYEVGGPLPASTVRRGRAGRPRSRRRPRGKARRSRRATSPRPPRTSTAVPTSSCWRYLGEGNAPDAPGNFAVWLHTRAPLYGYRFSGEWRDIGDIGQLLDADNLLRGRAGLPQRADITQLAHSVTN